MDDIGPLPSAAPHFVSKSNYMSVNLDPSVLQASGHSQRSGQPASALSDDGTANAPEDNSGQVGSWTSDSTRALLSVTGIVTMGQRL